jgi:hypothetical protein
MEDKGGTNCGKDKGADCSNIPAAIKGGATY